MSSLCANICAAIYNMFLRASYPSRHIAIDYVNAAKTVTVFLLILRIHIVPKVTGTAPPRRGVFINNIDSGLENIVCLVGFVESN